jgi:hypothetical protein
MAPAKLERCVREVRGKGGAVDPWAVCEASVMGKGRSKGKRNPEEIPMDTDDYNTAVRLMYPDATGVSHDANSSRVYFADGSVKVVTHKKLQRVWWDKIGNKKSRRNPADQSAAMYSSFHGKPSTEVVEVEEREHYHGNLAELGVLVELGVETRDGYEVWLGFDAESEGADAGSNPIWPFGPGQPLGTKTTVRRVGKGYKPSTKSTTKGLYKGYMIYEYQGGAGGVDGFVVPQIDRDSVFESKKEARRFIDDEVKLARRNGRNGNGKRRGPISDAVKSVTDIGDWADQSLGRAIGYRRNPVLDESDPRYGAAIYNAAVKADDRFQAALEKEYGKRAGDMRYHTSKQTPEIRRLGQEYQRLNDERRKWGAKYGPVVRLKTNPNTPDAISTSTVLLTSNEDGSQLYFVGGDQSLDLDALKLSEHEQSKELIVIGDCFFVSYMTEKEFDGFEQIVYEHDLGEETGVVPTLLYDRVNKRLKLASGEYHIERPMLETSPGIEN